MTTLSHHLLTEAYNNACTQPSWTETMIWA